MNAPVLDGATPHASATLDDRIRELFAALLQVPRDTVGEHTRPATLERWDSMQHLILVSGFEEEFGIDVDPEEAVEMYEDYQTFRRIVRGKLNGRV